MGIWYVQQTQGTAGRIKVAFHPASTYSANPPIARPGSNIILIELGHDGHGSPQITWFSGTVETRMKKQSHGLQPCTVWNIPALLPRECRGKPFSSGSNNLKITQMVISQESKETIRNRRAKNSVSRHPKDDFIWFPTSHIFMEYHSDPNCFGEWTIQLTTSFITSSIRS